MRPGRTIEQTLVEILAHRKAGAMQPRPHDFFGEVEDVRGVLGGKFLYITEQHHRPVGIREPGDGFIERLPQFRLEHLVFGKRGPVGNLNFELSVHALLAGHQLFEREFPGGREDASPALHQAGVTGDAEDPGPHPFGLAKLVETLEHFQQCLLRHFFGIFSLAAHQPAVVKDLRTEVVDETVESIRFAGDQPPGKFNFFFALQT